MNDKRKSTRARAPVGEYALSRDNPEVRQILASLNDSDLEHYKLRALELTPAGQTLLKTILRMTIKRPLGGWVDQPYIVRSFTRAELGNELRSGAPLNPHDIKLLRDMVRLSIIQEDRRALPAKRLVGVTGDELMLGAGWEYVYVVRPLAALAYLYASKNHRAFVEKLRAEQPYTPDVSWLHKPLWKWW